MEFFKKHANVFESSVFDYANNIYGEHYSVPAFQREFVWKKGANKKKVTNLLDSIYKGYNIGSIIFWESSLINISRVRDNLNPSEKEGSMTYILDGQQRTLALLTLFSQTQVVELDLKNIFIFLNKKTEKLEFQIGNKGINADGTISMNFLDFKNKVLFGGVENYNFFEAYFKEGFSDYLIQTFAAEMKIFVSNVKGENLLIGHRLNLGRENMDKAIEQFEKINESGVKLNYFEILDAVAYTTNFKLAEQFKRFDDRFGGIKKTDAFSSNSQKIILNTYKLVKNYRLSGGKDISLSANAIAKFEREDGDILEGIIKEFSSGTAELLAMGISSLDDVPYTHNIVAYLFAKICFPEHMLELTDRDFLYSVMFQTGIMKSYDKSASQKLVKHISILIKSLVNGTPINLKDEGVIFQLNTTDILNTDYKKKKAMEKAILLYWITILKPKDFLLGTEVALTNIKHKATNLDHIFPKSKYKGISSINSFANIALIEAKTNKTKSAVLPAGFFSGIPYDSKDEMYASQTIDKELWNLLINNEAGTFINQRAEAIAEDVDNHFKSILNGVI